MIPRLLESHRRKEEMEMVFLLCAVFMQSFFSSNASLSHIGQAKPNCQASCGDVDVPYPFGIGPNCSIHDDFVLDCSTSSTPPKLYWGDQEVVNISLAGEMSVAMEVSYLCYHISEGSVYSVKNFNMDLMQYGAFTFSSTRNKFFAVGCDTLAILSASGGKNFSAGCMSYCTDDKGATNGTCDGIGCCQVPIPSGVRNVGMQIRSFSNYTQFNGTHDKTCSYAFLADVNQFEFAVPDIQGEIFWYKRHNYSVVVDWAIGQANETCMTEMNRTCLGGQCYNSPAGLGYRCMCPQGYDGNPYLLNGCQDINECTTNLHNCSDAIYCHNKLGSFDCICPKGFVGDGRQGGSGCTTDNSLPIPETILAILSAVGFILIGISRFFHRDKNAKISEKKEKFFQRNGGYRLGHFPSSCMDETNMFFQDEELMEANSNDKQKRTIRGCDVFMIKKVNKDDYMKYMDSYIEEIIRLHKIHKRSMVQLLGCCLQTEIPSLVFGFNPMNVFDSITEQPCSSDIIGKRLMTVAETAKVLSDSSKIDIMQGTLGHLFPKYMYPAYSSETSDVRGFGMLLTELLMAVKGIHAEKKQSWSQEEDKDGHCSSPIGRWGTLCFGLPTPPYIVLSSGGSATKGNDDLLSDYYISVLKGTPLGKERNDLMAGVARLAWECLMENELTMEQVASKLEKLNSHQKARETDT